MVLWVQSVLTGMHPEGGQGYFHLDLTRTPFIGDDDRDAAAAAAAECPFHRVSDARSLLDITLQLLEMKGTPKNA